MSKTDAVMNHLRERGSITSMEAFKAYGVTRLSAIIFNLRKRGVSIESVPMTMRDRFGTDVRYAKYVLRQNEDSQGKLPMK